MFITALTNQLVQPLIDWSAALADGLARLALGTLCAAPVRAATSDSERHHD